MMDSIECMSIYLLTDANSWLEDEEETQDNLLSAADSMSRQDPLNAQGHERMAHRGDGSLL